VGEKQADVTERLLGEYCREVEAYLCRKNDGHLIRITGPSFDVVTKWVSMTVPLKVAFRGIDRCVERYYRSGARRRPVKIDFCDADVLDVFDEWRRALGLAAEPAHGAGDPSAKVQRSKRGPSLPEHLERVLTRLSSLRARGVLTAAADPVIDRVSAELDGARTSSTGLRGDARRELFVRLSDLDSQLIRLATELAPPALLETIRNEAAAELAPYRRAMTADEFALALRRAVAHGVRERLALPTIAFG
jgi:hypothetical protein